MKKQTPVFLKKNQKRTKRIKSLSNTNKQSKQVDGSRGKKLENRCSQREINKISRSSKHLKQLIIS
jgi:hypothetical protein